MSLPFDVDPDENFSTRFSISIPYPKPTQIWMVVTAEVPGPVRDDLKNNPRAQGALLETILVTCGRMVQEFLQSLEHGDLTTAYVAFKNELLSLLNRRFREQQIVFRRVIMLDEDVGEESTILGGVDFGPTPPRHRMN